MFKNRFRMISFFVLAGVILFLVACDLDDDSAGGFVPGSNVRVIHASYNAPAVDATFSTAINSTTFGGLVYGGAAAYDRITFDRTVSLTLAGTTTPELTTAAFNVDDGANQTFLAVDQATAVRLIGAADERSASPDKVKVRFIHASPDAPGVDIKLDTGDGPVVFDDTEFEGITDYIEIDPGSYTFVVTGATSNTALITFNAVALQAGTVYTVVALGTLDGTDSFPFLVRVYVDSGDGDQFVDLTSGDTTSVMFIHTSPDAPPVDIYSDGVFQANIDFPENTNYIVLPAGDRNLKVNVEGTDTTAIGPAIFTIAKDTFTSVFAVDRVAQIDALDVLDDLSAPSAGKAKVRFLHLSPDAPPVDITLTDGSILFGDFEFKEVSPFNEFDPGTYDLQVRLTGSTTVVLSIPGVVLDAGKIYTIFANGLVTPGPNEPSLAADIIVNN